jgi:hypothetical protein
MAKPKYDGVVEAVHYQTDGQVAWVRAYLRRGPTFSDRILLDRERLVGDLKAGKRYLAGKRIPLMAGTFEVADPVHIAEVDGHEVLITGDRQSGRDRLEGIPVI